MGLLNWWLNSTKARLTRCKRLVKTQSLNVLLGKQVQTLVPRDQTPCTMGLNHRKQSEEEMGRLDFEVELGTKGRRNCDRV